MSTRGYLGYYKNGVDKGEYNHWDSYPTGLGNKVIDLIRQWGIENLNEFFDKIELVDYNDIPTDLQKETVFNAFGGKKEFMEQMGAKTEKDLERVTAKMGNMLSGIDTGDIDIYLNKGLKYMCDDTNFMGNSLFCEWGYIINLDTKMLEIYKGWNKETQNNRFTKYADKKQNSDYVECRLVKEMPLKDIINPFSDIDN